MGRSEGKGAPWQLEAAPGPAGEEGVGAGREGLLPQATSRPGLPWAYLTVPCADLESDRLAHSPDSGWPWAAPSTGTQLQGQGLGRPPSPGLGHLGAESATRL